MNLSFMNLTFENKCIFLSPILRKIVTELINEENYTDELQDWEPFTPNYKYYKRYLN